jgi:hypothetical protein
MPSKQWWDELNMEFEDDPVGDRPNLEGAVMAGGVTVAAVTIEAKDGAMYPALLYRFVGQEGKYLQPILFVADAETFRKLDALTRRATVAAIRKAGGK